MMEERGATALFEGRRAQASSNTPSRFYSTAGKYGFTVLPGDTQEHDDINPCTFEPESTSSVEPPFDYCEFMEYNRLQVLLFQVQAMNDPTLKEERQNPSDAFVKSLFTRMYGIVDFEAEEMPGVLQSMKESLIEQCTADPSEIFLKLLDEGISTADPTLAELQVEELIASRFGGEKISRYSTLDPREADGEWFVLPRGSLTDIRERNFAEVSYPIEITTDCLGRTNAHQIPLDSEEQPLSNLVLYDPKFEFTRRIFTKDDPNWEVHTGIPPGISQRILALLNEFPLGVTATEFWCSYASKYKALPSVGKLRPSELLFQHEKELWVVKNPAQGLPPLVFPAFLENIVCPETVLKRVWHAIKCVIGDRSFISEEELFSILDGPCYRLKFRPMDWGFQNIAQFIKFCNKKFGTDAITVHRVIFTEEGKRASEGPGLRSVRQVDYILLDSNQLRRQVDAHHGIVFEPDKMPIVKAIPIEFLGLNDGILALSNEISPLDVIPCGLKFMSDPSNMVVGSRRYEDRLEEFMEMLPSLKEVYEVIHRKPPAPDMIRIGMFALGFVEQYTGGGWRSGKNEWFRVKVLRRSLNGMEYETYSIDYGFISVVPLENMRLLPRGHASDEPAHAIPIRLMLSHPQRNTGFNRKKTDAFTDIIFDIADSKRTDLNITPITGRFKDTLGMMKWKVTCSVSKRSPMKDVLYRDVTPVFYKKFREHLDMEAKKKLERKRVDEKDVADADTSVSGADKSSSDDNHQGLNEASSVIVKQGEPKMKVLAEEETSSED